MNKMFITPLRKYILQKYNFISIKSCNFARSTHKPSINHAMNKLRENFTNPQDNTIDLDELKQNRSSDKENFDMPNLDEIFGKDENFSQKENHRTNSKKSSPKDEEEDMNLSQSKEQSEYIYGRAACEAVLQSSNRQIDEVTILVDYRVGPPEKIKNLLDIANKRKLKIKYMKKERLDKLARDSKHNGIMIKCSKRDYLTLKKFSELKSNLSKPNKNIVVIIDKITDNYNFSNVIRSSVFLGADSIIVNREDRPQLNSLIAKISNGASEVAKIYSIKFIKQFLGEAKADGWSVIGARAEKDDNESNSDRHKIVLDSNKKEKSVYVTLDKLQIKQDSNAIVLISTDIESHLNSLDNIVSVAPHYEGKLANKNLYNIVDSLNPGVSIGFILNHLNNNLQKLSSGIETNKPASNKNSRSNK